MKKEILISAMAVILLAGLPFGSAGEVNAATSIRMVIMSTTAIMPCVRLCI